MHDCRVEFIRPGLSIQIVIGRMNSALQVIRPIDITLMERRCMTVGSNSFDRTCLSRLLLAE
ncbi:hypothetical protein MNBD_GAMMA13-1887 [hydrothermal vent metagenome]|uniref:Uncharacterized protein n=1 Tax=hydrothermal vent metagenome TaxID=652676 RepID=A0A3B0YYT8_9ZZZZ